MDDTDYTVTFADLQRRDAAVVSATVSLAELPEHLGAAFAETAAVAQGQGLRITGPPFARYRVDAAGGFEVDAGFPVSSPVSASGRVQPAALPGGTVARTVHVGDYAAVAAAYDAVRDHLVAQGYECTEAPWESYLDEPDVAAPRTEVFLPCRPVGATTAQASAGRSL